MSLKKKTILAAMTGNALEYYDFTLFGFFAVYLSPLYFPSDSPTTSLIASFGAFAAGFLMRPIGGFLFGHLGDKYGRKTALYVSVLVIAFPTLIIGLLPTYSQIGVMAPAMIIICRLVQGICAAGEYTGAVVLIAEYTGENKPGFACSLLPTSSLVGAIFGTVLGTLCLAEVMPSWAWRIPFIMGFVFGLFALYLRKNIDESPEFIKNKQINPAMDSPIIEIFKYKKSNFLCAMGIGATAIAPFYIISLYIMSLTSQFNLSASERMGLNIGILVLWMIFIPIIGFFSDRLGLKKTMSCGAVLLASASIPVFLFLSHNLSIEKIILSQIILSFCGAFFVAPMGAFLASIFPPSSRYTGIAIGLSCGEALFGGTAPLIATSLVVLVGSSIAPGFYLSFCGILGLIAVTVSRAVSTLPPPLEITPREAPVLK
jgi:MHS family proline/betaine transporter-like MFS transporter